MKVLAISVVLAAAVVAAYLPALHGQFLSWDDNLYIVENPHVRVLSWENVRWAFTTTHTGNWIPLTWLSHMLDGELYGLEPFGHHLTALVLHVANTVLVFVVVRALTGALWRSAAVAALFGLHPLHVESVAWVAERKDLLSALFWLLTLAAYVRYVRRPSAASYVMVAVAFVAGLLAKPMAVTLPLVLLLLDYWPLRRLSRRAVAEKGPLLLAALACSLAALAAQASAGGTRAVAQIPLLDRVTNALVSYVRYLGFTVWPVRLSPWYLHPTLDGPPLAPTVVAGAMALLGAVSVLAIVMRRQRPYLLVGWAWYLITLLPVIGLVQVGSQGMADRYTYIPLLGVFLAVVWEIGAAPWWSVAMARRAATVATVAVLASLAVLTTRQVRVWHDSMTFWTETLARTPRAAVAYYALAARHAAAGRIEAAIAAHQRALKLRPDYVNAHREVAILLARRGRLAAAAAHYRKALANGDQPAEDHNNLANILLNQGYLAPARRHLERALALQPDFAEAHNNLGIVFAEDGRPREAEAEFRAALHAKPQFAPARQNLAALLARRAATDTGAPAPR